MVRRAYDAARCAWILCVFWKILISSAFHENVKPDSPPNPNLGRGSPVLLEGNDRLPAEVHGEQQLRYRGAKEYHLHNDGSTEHVGIHMEHKCSHADVRRDRKFNGIETVIVPQAYLSLQPRNNQSTNEVDLQRDRMLQESSVWQPIRIEVSYDSLAANPDYVCSEAGGLVKIGSPPARDVQCQVSADEFRTIESQNCWYTCMAEDVVDGDKFELLEEVFADVVAWFQKLLTVERVQGLLRLSGTTSCGRDGGVAIPPEFRDEGVASDLVLMVTARPTTGATLAWAVACERDQWGRSIAGQVNVGPRHLDATNREYLETVLKHELTHVLGFDPDAFDQFRDETHSLRQGLVTTTFDPEYQRFVKRFKSPKVEMYARQHFWMDSEQDFPGIELEDDGGEGTADSHWERRVMGAEVMTGTVALHAVYSRITLALLEDSGWYQVQNESQVEPFLWGRYQGLDFLTGTCSSRQGSYKCTEPGVSNRGCIPTRRAVGYCDEDYLSDGCMEYVPFTNGDCEEGDAQPIYGETRAPGSRCLSSSLVNPSYIRDPSSAIGCYQTRCTVIGTLEVAVNDIWQTCAPEGGQLLSWSGYGGHVACPPAVELCGMMNASLGGCPDNCNFQGLCVDSKCECFLGRSGDSCEMQVCLNDCSGHGECKGVGYAGGGTFCACFDGYSGLDCSAKECPPDCFAYGGVCNGKGVCEVSCSNKVGYACMNLTVAREGGLEFCEGEFVEDAHICAPEGSGGVQQVENQLVVPQFSDVTSDYVAGISLPSLPFTDAGPARCEEHARSLLCHSYLQVCDHLNATVGVEMVCESKCEAMNQNCWTKMDCSDEILFARQAPCFGDAATVGWFESVEMGWIFLILAVSLALCCCTATCRRCIRSRADQANSQQQMLHVTV
mmetsp:Transcript_37608/g.70546  ORF Transcript_37608/g.70546 Transcript_37608/m.70546 type:complete len:895 (+) Transcript_37608:43-2727(+)